MLLHPWFSHYEEKIKMDISVAKSAFENMKRFKRNKKFEHATIGFIINQLVSKEDRADLLNQFLFMDKNKDGVLTKEEIIESYRNVYGTIDPDVVENIIKSIDLDGNGVIDYHEFLNCTMNRNKILSKKNLEYAFNSFEMEVFPLMK